MEMGFEEASVDAVLQQGESDIAAITERLLQSQPPPNSAQKSAAARPKDVLPRPASASAARSLPVKGTGAAAAVPAVAAAPAPAATSRSLLPSWLQYSIPPATAPAAGRLISPSPQRRR
jgi:hypothetical protein